MKVRRVAAVLAVAAIGSFCAAEQAAAQRAGSLVIDVAECVEIESPAERFRCYESRVDAALGEQGREARAGDASAGSGRGSSAALPSTAAPAAVTSRQSARAAADEASGAGRTQGASAARAVTLEREIDLVGGSSAGSPTPAAADTARRSNGDDDQEEFFATVESVRELAPNRNVVTLDNGQVWRQMRPSFYPLRPGHRVRVYSTRWGSARRMSAEELNGFIQVERIR